MIVEAPIPAIAIETEIRVLFLEIIRDVIDAAKTPAHKNPNSDLLYKRADKIRNKTAPNIVDVIKFEGGSMFRLGFGRKIRKSGQRATKNALQISPNVEKSDAPRKQSKITDNR